MTQKTIGEQLLEILERDQHITKEDVQFIQEDTTFLTHRNFMSSLNFTTTHWKYFEQLQTFWTEISRMFPKEKRKVFWRLYMRMFKKIRNSFAAGLHDRQILLCDNNWKIVANLLFMELYFPETV